VVNQVQRAYNSFQQLTREYHEHGGAVSTSTSLCVDYLYADGSTNTIRRAGCVYPNGRNVSYHSANPVDEITDITNTTGDAWSQPGYDAAGNMTTIPRPADMTSSYVATYDAWNRLTKLVDATTSQVFQENQYDGMNRRVIRHNYGFGFLTETRHFYYSDGWQVLEERVDDEIYTPDRQYVWGLRYIDDLILRDRSNGGTLNERYHNVADANWNTVTLVDSTTSANVVQRFNYTPCGLPSFLDSSFNASTNTKDWETLFCGYRYEITTGLMSARERWLHSLLGCWLTRDPLGFADGMNQYSYALQSPLSKMDSTGLSCKSDCESAYSLQVAWTSGKLIPCLIACHFFCLKWGSWYVWCYLACAGKCAVELTWGYRNAKLAYDNCLKLCPPIIVPPPTPTPIPGPVTLNGHDKCNTASCRC
jgi:RHS repeat-associated protein